MQKQYLLQDLLNLDNNYNSMQLMRIHRQRISTIIQVNRIWKSLAKFYKMQNAKINNEIALCVAKPCMV